MKDTLALFAAVPASMQLHISYDHYFKPQYSTRERVIQRLEKIRKLITPSKPESDANDQTNDEKETDTSVKQYQQNVEELYLRVSYATYGVDDYTQAALDDAFAKSRKTFVPKGSLTVKKKPSKPRGMSRSQACNFFHIPTNANPVKQLQYAVYRKLPFPSHLPTLENTPKTDLTVLGKTDFK
jgi:hypothetical protein